MSMNWKSGLGLLAMGLIVGVALMVSSDRSAAQKDTAKGSYSVVNTDGAHLIVVDNAANKLYFYTIDKDGKVGDDLKLRGTLNLQDVGKPALKPIDAKPQAK
jgi:hypothetical protein